MLVQRLSMSSVVRCLQQYSELVCRLRFLMRFDNEFRSEAHESDELQLK